MKKALDQLETKVLNWLKPMPHLPANITKWIAENIWWLTLIGVIASVIGSIMIVVALVTALLFLGGTSSLYNYYYATNNYTGWSIFVIIVSLLFMIATTVITAMAVGPLKKMHKKVGAYCFYYRLQQLPIRFLMRLLV